MTNLSPSQMEQVMNGKVAGKLWPKKVAGLECQASILPSGTGGGQV